jgi:hypothetical protein
MGINEVTDMQTDEFQASHSNHSINGSDTDSHCSAHLEKECLCAKLTSPVGELTVFENNEGRVP